MPYSNKLAERIRKRLSTRANVKEKEMMGGLTFMYNDKMCIGIIGEELMCRIDPAMQQEALAKKGCRQMDFTGRPMKGFVMVSDAGLTNKTDLEYWINLCLVFNKKAKSSRKKK